MAPKLNVPDACLLVHPARSRLLRCAPEVLSKAGQAHVVAIKEGKHGVIDVPAQKQVSSRHIK